MDRELLLLGILREQEMHGYELHDFIDKTLASCTDMKKSTAYYLLKKLEEAGYISQETKQEGNRPPKQVYKLTSAGENKFQNLLRHNLSQYNKVYLTDDIGMVFLDELKLDETLALLNKRRLEMIESLAYAENIPSHGENLQWVFDHLVHHLKSEVAWIDSVITRLKKNK
ncbi:MAG: helix-turn-helix transcriptional regulator [Anaerolineaceae bacterium]|nr:helix-turn-helix transcriptional regulator [Anaerolineaceae bacterium]